MVTVFPRFLSSTLSLVGLGDVLVPGVHLAVLRRFDAHTARAWYRGYFFIGLVGYAVGLFATMTVAYVFASGQPALLFLIPLVHAPPMLFAWWRGELRMLWRGKRVANHVSDSEEALLENADE